MIQTPVTMGCACGCYGCQSGKNHCNGDLCRGSS
jgi:hypothetical protein